MTIYSFSPFGYEGALVTVEVDLRRGIPAIDIVGLNYRTHKYHGAYERLHQKFLLGSETASTVSSRGVYHFPVVRADNKRYDDGQCSGYDLEACSWSNIPEDDWVLQDDFDYVIGEFVWTGFDYLGEPTPYDASPHPTTIARTRVQAPSASSTSPACPKTDITCIAAAGTPQPRPYTCCHTGRGRGAKAK